MLNPQYLLRPVSPPFIIFSLAMALVLDFMPWGRQVGVPDFVALVLVFWSTHQPRRVGIGVAFAMGLLVDVEDATLLGQHALAYTLLSFGAITVHRRLLWFSPRVQALHVLPLFLIAQCAGLVVRFVADGSVPNALILLESGVDAALWPLASWLLMAPQRRPQDRDENRPI
jgi:rod shape-determining protein MreD